MNVGWVFVPIEFGTLPEWLSRAMKPSLCDRVRGLHPEPGVAQFDQDIMAWIDDLEKDAWNVVIDELVWHLREGRMPVIVRRRSTPSTGVEFCFESAQPAFLAIEQSFFKEHWEEAVAIIGRCSELSTVKIHDA